MPAARDHRPSASSTRARLCEYIRAVESETDKRVVSARIEGRAIVLEFETGARQDVNPADLIDMRDG